MSLFILNIALAFGWMAFTGSFTSGALMLGLGLGFFMIWAMQPLFGGARYVQSVGGWISLIGHFFWDLIRSSVEVALDVLTPRLRAEPALVEVELDATTEEQVALIANLVTLTPGTLSLDVSADGRKLLVHAMFGGDAETVRAEIKNGVERRVLRAMS